MRYILSFILTLFSQFSVAGVIPKVEEAYFTIDQFSNCLANELAREYDATTLRSKLSSIQTLRDRYAREAEKPETCKAIVQVLCGLVVGPQLEEQLGAALAPLGCVVNRAIERGLLYHSAPLVNCSKPLSDAGKSLYWKLATLQTGPRSRSENLNHVDGLLQQVQDTSIRVPNFSEASESFRTQRDCALRMAQPLIEWLLQQKYHEVTHWQLVRKAKEIYGDTFTAIGIIGQLFDSERMACNNRHRNCVLGNRMKPLFESDSSDSVGHNYHFWAHLTRVLDADGTQEELANYLLEWVKDNDAGDYSSNRLGIRSSLRTTSRAKLLTAPLNRVFGIADRKCDLN